jgi:hypothetical protein
MGPGTGRSGGPRATPADTLRALAGDISEYLGSDALTAIARGLVEDAPGWEYADVLPRAVNRETGERSWAVPGMARDVAKGLWELMQGPYMEPGQNLSPEAVLSLPAMAVPAGAALAPRGAIGMFAGRNAKGIAPEDMIVLNRGGGVQASAPLRDLSGATGAMKYGQHSPSLDLNYALREGTPLKPDQEEMVKALDASMGEHGYGSLYRGVRSGPYAFAKPGDIISDPAFMSFSVDRDQAGVFAMGDPRAGPAIIHLQRAHKVPGYMGLRDTGESEIVLPRNTPLQVIEVRPGDSRAGGAPIVVVRPVSATD